jgi:hypothetical protein
MSETMRLRDPGGPTPALPDARAIGAAFNTPILEGCDELTCWYTLARVFRIRALQCSASPTTWPESMQARCRYERQHVPMEGEPGPWHAAETEFIRSTDPAPHLSRWRVEREWTPP